jgi:hypothetical protein
MLPRVKFSVATPSADRVHYVNEHDVRIVLSRLPIALWRRLRAVHFTDRPRARVLGYVTAGMREITLCALPPRIGLTKALRWGQTAEQFGAKQGQKWPTLAVRRFMLYAVFLHELGHLQVIDDAARSDRLKFAREKLAHEFALEWCARLWSTPFPHSDPIHNPPSPEELDRVGRTSGGSSVQVMPGSGSRSVIYLEHLLDQPGREVGW